MHVVLVYIVKSTYIFSNQFLQACLQQYKEFLYKKFVHNFDY